MALAFLILAHKNTGQVERLFSAVHHPEDVVVLHFDRRADPSLHRLGRELAAQHGNVIVLPARSILWGGHQTTSVQLEAIAAALKAPAKWSTFLNLSGQDFPIKRREELEARLARDPEANHVTWFDPLAVPLWVNARSRMERYHLWWPWLDRALRVPGLGRKIRSLFGWENRLVHLPGVKRAWPDFRYYGGSNHVALSRAACEYITSDPAAHRIARWLEHAAHPDEILFQSVLLNSRFAPTVVNSNFHAVEFRPHAPHPRTLKLADFDKLVGSPMYFARKFDEMLEPQILDRLTEHLRLRAGVR